MLYIPASVRPRTGGKDRESCRAEDTFGQPFRYKWKKEDESPFSFPQPPLLVAVSKAYVEIVKTLLDHNADLDCSSPTPLQAAIIEEHEGVV
jgi:hypothetical protein